MLTSRPAEPTCLPPQRAFAGAGFATQLALAAWHERSRRRDGSASPRSIICSGSWGQTSKSCFPRPWEQPSWAPACWGQAWARRPGSQAARAVVLQAKPGMLFAIKTAQPFPMQGLTSCRWTSANFKALEWSFLAPGEFSPSSPRALLERTRLLGPMARSGGEAAGCTERNSGGEITAVTVLRWDVLPRKHQALYNPTQASPCVPVCICNSGGSLQPGTPAQVPRRSQPKGHQRNGNDSREQCWRQSLWRGLRAADFRSEDVLWPPKHWAWEETPAKGPGTERVGTTRGFFLEAKGITFFQGTWHCFPQQVFNYRLANGKSCNNYVCVVMLWKMP